MTNHPDASTLTDIEQVAGWHALALISHVGACGECRDDLAALERLHDSAPAIPPDAGFEAAVLRDLAARAPSRPRAVTPALFPAVAACTWLALAFGWWSSTGSAGMPPVASIVLALATGTVVTMRGRLPAVAMVASLLLSAACAPTLESAAPSAVASDEIEDNAFLNELAGEDQAYIEGVEVARTTAERSQLVLRELGVGRVRTAADRFNAALVLDHSPLTVRDGRLVAMSPENFLLAHYLAGQAFAEGYDGAAWLMAATLDRYLSLTVGYQKYGTNVFVDLDTGVEYRPYIDRATTDAERAALGVPPLAELLATLPERRLDPVE